MDIPADGVPADSDAGLTAHPTLDTAVSDTAVSDTAVSDTAVSDTAFRPGSTQIQR